MAKISAEGEPRTNSLSAKISAYLDSSETWEKSLRRQISKRVRTRYRHQISQQIKSDYRFLSRREKVRRSEHRENLQYRIVAGETTGDFPTDACFALFGVINEDTVQRIGALKNRLDEGFNITENPYIFLVYSKDGEPYSIKVAELEKPGLEVAYDKLAKGTINLNITTTNGRTSACKGDRPFSILTINSNIDIGWELKDIYPQVASEKVTQQDSEKVITLYLGLKETSDFVKLYPEFAETVLLALSKYIKENEEAVSSVFNKAREQEKFNFVFKSMSKSFSSLEWLPDSFKSEVEDDLDITSGRLDFYSQVSELMEKAYMIMLVGAYIGESGVVYVDDREEEVNRIETRLSGLIDEPQGEPG